MANVSCVVRSSRVPSTRVCDWARLQRANWCPSPLELTRKVLPTGSDRASVDGSWGTNCDKMRLNDTKYRWEPGLRVGGVVGDAPWRWRASVLVGWWLVVQATDWTADDPRLIRSFAASIGSVLARGSGELQHSQSRLACRRKIRPVRCRHRRTLGSKVIVQSVSHSVSQSGSHSVTRPERRQSCALDRVVVLFDETM